MTMRSSMQCLAALAWLVLAHCVSAEQKFFIVHDFADSSGNVVTHCPVGYRTYGNMNEDRSNIVVFPTWFGGTTADFENLGKVGPAAFADSDKYFVITIDSLGNGVSCSPSNSKLESGEPFQLISTRDMVNSQYELLTGHLGIDHVHAVMGISMGGMQVFRWLEMYPEFMDKVVIADGSPRMTSYDLLQWRTHKEIGRKLQRGGYSDVEVGSVLSRLSYLTLFTPQYFVESVPAAKLGEFLAPTDEGNTGFSVDDYVSQLDAMMSHDVIGVNVNGVAEFARRVRADVLVIGTASDHMVNPAPAKQLATEIGATYLEVSSHCGHIGTSCEGELVDARVAEFLAE